MFRIKQIVKMFLQNVLLPLVYAWYARKPVEKGRILFADAHHEEIPFSMRRVYEALAKGNTAPDEESAGRYADAGETRTEDERRITVCVRNFDRMPYGELMRYLLRFMRQYATAEYVFICDYYLPVAACRKRPETTVVQLWHSCGLMKRIAHDAGQDIPKGYRGNMFGNYTYLTLSAQVCVPVHARALRIPEERIRAIGISRTDYYFDEEWNRRCREAFYGQYPQARGKRIALWAPTFRGNAAMPRLEGLQEIRRAAEALKEEWYFVIRAHPHVDAHGQISNCSIPTEELLPVTDLMITDYSSIMFDFLLYRKPIVLFAPDLEQYEAERGFYLNYREIPYPLAQTEEELVRAIAGSADVLDALDGDAFVTKKEPECVEEEPGRTEEKPERAKEELGVAKKGDGKRVGRPEEIDRFREKYVGACDGHATERILELVQLG